MSPLGTCIDFVSVFQMPSIDILSLANNAWTTNPALCYVPSFARLPCEVPLEPEPLGLCPCDNMSIFRLSHVGCSFHSMWSGAMGAPHATPSPRCFILLRPAGQLAFLRDGHPYL
jgi:hypothetical protein